MLGQLFHNFGAATRRPPPRSRTLDSVTEDSHTFGLLFPDVSFPPDHDGSPQSLPAAELLTQSLPPHLRGSVAGALAGAATDHVPDSAELDLEHPRDIRVLIAQAGTTGTQEGLPLFDSKPAPPPTPAESPRLTHSRGSSRNENIGPIIAPSAATTNAAVGTASAARSAAGRAAVPPIQEDHRHRRTSSSLSNTAVAAATSGLGAFQRARARRGSISSVHSISEGPGRTEGEDVERIALGCMFENMMSSYKGTSNKVHIIPLVAKPYDSTMCSTSLTNDFGSLSLARPPVIRRPSSLSRSHMPGDQPDPEMQLRDADTAPQNQPGRRIVLVTRTFSITWVDDEVADEQRLAPKDPKDTPERPPRLSKRRTNRSPMFAITIILHLPISPSDSSPPVSRTGTFGRKTLRKDSTSLSHTSLASSIESDKRGPSYFMDPLFGLEGLATSFSSDVDEKVDLIGQHWDVISRTLTTLQSLVQNKLLALLKPLSQQQRPTRLPRMALAIDQDVKKAVDDGCIRIIRGMKIPRVHTGHGQWSAWREEARWLKNWAGKKDDAFLPILISAFLGTHTDWLHTLAPKWYRRKYREQHRNSLNDSSVPCRTVILAADKMAARRMVFLLSAFLPSDTSVRGDASPLRPSTAASFRAYSQSPPKVYRKESLRRALNRRGKAGLSRTSQSISRTSSIVAAPESLDGTETGTVRGEDAAFDSPRPADDTRSKLPQTEMDPSGQRTSTPTSSVTPASVEIRPFFSRRPSMGGAQSTHSRTSSAASATLMQPLTRTASTGAEPPRPTRWGSLRSLWPIGSRRESATEFSEVLQTTDEGLGIAGARNITSPTKLQKMVDELHGIATEVVVDSQSSTTDSQHPTAFPSPELHGGDGSGTSPEQEPSPAHARKYSQPIDVPIKLSVNKDDGVIDVEVPFPDFGSPSILIPPTTAPLAPFSPSTGGPTAPLIFPGSSSHSESHSLAGSSAPSHHSASLAAATMSPRDAAERAPNVAGWLDRVHPDFTLQAVRPYADALRDIRAAMSAEPNPPVTATTQAAWRAADAAAAAAAAEPTGGSAPQNPGPAAPTERWLDVCTALVADATARMVHRIRLRRRVRFVRQSAFAPSLATTPGTPAGGVGSAGVRSLYGNPYSHAVPPFGSGPPAGGTAAGVAGIAAAAAGATASSEFTLEERFLEELIAESDPAFAEALERAIWGTGSGSGGGLLSSVAGAIAPTTTTPAGDEDERTPRIAALTRPTGSRSSSTRGRADLQPPDDVAGLQQLRSATVDNHVVGRDLRGRRHGEAVPPALTMTPAVAVPARDARSVVVGALEGIAGEVAAARARHGVGVAAGPGPGGVIVAESALREGVRVWMEEVEAGGRPGMGVSGSEG
jgi:hypothetical protein